MASSRQSGWYVRYSTYIRICLELRSHDGISLRLLISVTPIRAIKLCGFSSDSRHLKIVSDAHETIALVRSVRGYELGRSISRLASDTCVCRLHRLPCTPVVVFVVVAASSLPWRPYLVIYHTGTHCVSNDSSCVVAAQLCSVSREWKPVKR